ncbi:MAG: KR domain-containing protein [Actinobacteria bacterium]|uniref:Unannotated protein n=1 Tax=freshwater metagenome TaxID=449393 RepID=A0A6J7E0L9_9ZZZZ|nr:KR domain-containing protein [Actinomycetota bacterium]
MTARVILFGATGYTGRLAAHSMVRAGISPVLAGRSASRLAELADDLAAVAAPGVAATCQVADVAEPATVQALVTDPSDVLVSTVGPFTALGDPAISAAIRAGAAYVDSTGEPPFIQRVFTDYHRQAVASGARLLTAFGYDYVPGNLAGALALTQARADGAVPTRVEIGYFVQGAFAMSSGTKASSAGVMFAPSFAFRHGRIAPERAAKETSSFEIDGRLLDGLTVGGSEHYTLPRVDTALTDVGVYLGWAGSRTKAMSRASGALDAVAAIPGARSLLTGITRRLTSGPTGTGPDALQRSGGISIAVARAFDESGALVAQTRVDGPTPYDLTADLLAWAASMLATTRPDGVGALGPADAFGLEALVAGCRGVGLKQQAATSAN